MSQSKTILVVDDDCDVLEQLSLILRNDGYAVQTAGGEEEGKEALLSSRPDLVIMDLMMDHKDSGFVLAHYSKRLYPDTPVILLTAVASVTGISFAAATSEARAWVKTDAVMDKPIRPEQLKAQIHKLLKDPQPAQHA
ncbi:MAG: response regulator [Planctomycetaceae bacterium]|nr:response regulator [Planctomycetaceae bacterium]